MYSLIYLHPKQTKNSCIMAEAIKSGGCGVGMGA